MNDKRYQLIRGKYLLTNSDDMPKTKHKYMLSDNSITDQIDINCLFSEQKRYFKNIESLKTRTLQTGNGSASTSQKS